MVKRMRIIMGAYAGAASQPQIMATNNAFKIVLPNANFTATAAKNPAAIATAPPPGTVGLSWIDNCRGFFVNKAGS